MFEAERWGSGEVADCRDARPVGNEAVVGEDEEGEEEDGALCLDGVEGMVCWSCG